MPSSSKWWLEVIKNGEVIGSVKLAEQMRVGRSAVEIELAHASISRDHAVLDQKDGRVYLKDVGSAHGTRLNKTTVPRQRYVELRDGDVMSFGASQRLFIVHGPVVESEGQRPTRLTLDDDVEDEPVEVVTWGFDEDAKEEEKLERSEKDVKFYEKLDAKQAKAGRIEEELKRFKAKPDLTDGQQRALDDGERSLAKLHDDIADLEETIRRKIASRRQPKHVVDDDDESTMRDLVPKLPPARTAEQKAARRRRRFQSGVTEEDPVTMTHETILEHRAKVQAKIDETPDDATLQAQAKDLDRLAAIAAPALPGLSAKRTTAPLEAAALDEVPRPSLLNEEEYPIQNTKDLVVPRRPRSPPRKEEAPRRPPPPVQKMRGPSVAETIAQLRSDAKDNRPPPKRRRTDLTADHDTLEGGDPAWQPPTGQDGSGRTALNDLLGY